MRPFLSFLQYGKQETTKQEKRGDSGGISIHSFSNGYSIFLCTNTIPGLWRAGGGACSSQEPIFFSRKFKVHNLRGIKKMFSLIVWKTRVWEGICEPRNKKIKSWSGQTQHFVRDCRRTSEEPQYLAECVASWKWLDLLVTGMNFLAQV